MDDEKQAAFLMVFLLILFSICAWGAVSCIREQIKHEEYATEIGDPKFVELCKKSCLPNAVKQINPAQNLCECWNVPE